MNLAYSTRAELDLLEIADYISDDSVRGAFDAVDRIDAAVRRLRDLPGLGRTRDDIGRPDLRSIGVDDWLILYSADDETVTIARIVHGARDLTTLLKRSKPR